MIDDPLLLLMQGIWLLAAGMYPLGFMLGSTCSPCCPNLCTSTQPEPGGVSVEITAVDLLYQKTEVYDTTGTLNLGLATEKISVALPTSALNGTHVLSKVFSSSNQSDWSKTISALLPSCFNISLDVTVYNNPSLVFGNSAWDATLEIPRAPGRMERQFSGIGITCPTPQYYSSFDQCEFLSTSCQQRGTISGGISFNVVCQNNELLNLPPRSNPFGTAELAYNPVGNLVSRTIDTDNRTTAVTIDDVIITRP
jgi:hypothetical protein